MNAINEFLKTVNIVDTETTNIDVEKAEIIEMAWGKYVNDSWFVESKLFGSNDPIPAEASAVNHISNRMIKGLSKFTENIDYVTAKMTDTENKTEYLVAHNAEYDRKVFFAVLDKTSTKKLFKEFRNEKVWICTWRLAKAVLDVDYNRMQYNLSFLRYHMDLNVSDELGAHRAESDVTTCGELLKELIAIAANKGKIDLEQPLGPQLVTLCYAPAIITIWPFGKHRGVPLKEIPTDYYNWAIDNMDCFKENSGKYDKDLVYSVEKILESRLSN